MIIFRSGGDTGIEFRTDGGVPTSAGVIGVPNFEFGVDLVGEV